MRTSTSQPTRCVCIRSRHVPPVVSGFDVLRLGDRDRGQSAFGPDHRSQLRKAVEGRAIEPVGFGAASFT